MAAFSNEPRFGTVPRLQIVTIEQALARGPDAVQTRIRHTDTYKAAPREKAKGGQGRSTYDGTTRPPRRLRCDESRSAEFKAGHAHAHRAAIAWLHWQAGRMNDPKARAILNAAADDLAAAFALAQRKKKAARHHQKRPRIIISMRNGRPHVRFRKV